MATAAANEGFLPNFQCEDLANLEQQVEEAAVLQAICGEDCLLLSPVLGAAGGGSSGSSSSVACEEPSDMAEPDLLALSHGHQMQLQLAVHVQLPPAGLRLQVTAPYCNFDTITCRLG